MIEMVNGNITIKIDEAEQKRIALNYLKSFLPTGFDDFEVEKGLLRGVKYASSHRMSFKEAIRPATTRDILVLGTIKELQ